MLQLCWPDGHLTGPALWGMLRSLQQELRKRGIKPGDLVALHAPISPAYICSLLALWDSGCISLTLNPRQPERVKNKALSAAGAVHLLGSKLTAHSLPLPTLTQARPLRQQQWAPTPEQPISLIQTSGSSTQPRLAQHAWGQHAASARGSLAHIPLQSSDRWLLALPLYHVGGLAVVVRCLLAEATLLLPGPEQDLAAAIVQLKPSHLSLVATQLQRLLNTSDAELLQALRACKAILLGGSALPRRLLQRAHGLGLNLHSSYGSTEMSSQISSTRADASLESLYTAGYVLPGRELQLQPDGEIWVRGETLFQGYRSPAGLELPLQPGGWFATRDRGEWDETGQLRILGRLDQMFISGGENIQPEEIEAALLQLDGVQQAVVVPVSEPEFGQRPAAFVSAADWQPAIWQEALRQGLPGFKIPLFFRPLPAQQGLKPARQKLMQAAQRYFDRDFKFL
ncbi:MAG: AMP-binding protein [Candidatus Sericytochromatia bacterium]|nr:AMP-binding protein [Candidatus Sericytochromatia bacterium]